MQVGDLVGAERGRRLIEDQETRIVKERPCDLDGVSRCRSRKDLDKRGLAGPVLAEQRVDLTGAHVQLRRTQRPYPSVALRKGFDGQQLAHLCLAHLAQVISSVIRLMRDRRPEEEPVPPPVGKNYVQGRFWVARYSTLLNVLAAVQSAGMGLSGTFAV